MLVDRLRMRNVAVTSVRTIITQPWLLYVYLISYKTCSHRKGYCNRAKVFVIWLLYCILLQKYFSLCYCRHWTKWICEKNMNYFVKFYNIIYEDFVGKYYIIIIKTLMEKNPIYIHIFLTINKSKSLGLYYVNI